MSFQDLERRPDRNISSSSSSGVAAGIFQLNTAVAGFRRLAESIGTSKDTPALRNALQDARKRIGQLAKETSQSLKSSFSQNSNSNAEERRLARELQAVLHDFHKAQSSAAEREATSPLPPTTTSGKQSGKFDDGDEESQAPLSQQKRQEVITLQNEIAFNEAMIEERDQGIKEINYDVEQVNEIYRDLAVLLHGQRSTIDDIDKQVEVTSASTALAKSQLGKSYNSTRSRFQWCFWVLIIFVMMLVILLIILIVH